jgi:hypothetical protein
VAALGRQKFMSDLYVQKLVRVCCRYYVVLMHYPSMSDHGQLTRIDTAQGTKHGVAIMTPAESNATNTAGKDAPVAATTTTPPVTPPPMTKFAKMKAMSDRKVCTCIIVNGTW